MKAMLKNKLGRSLNGDERVLLTSLYIRTDRVATLLVPSNVHPQLLDPSYDFIRLTSGIDANLELFEILRKRFPKVDSAMPASWVGLAGTGQAEMGTTMRIDRVVEPSPDIYALDRYTLDELDIPEAKGYLKTQIDLCAEIQRRYPQMNSPPVILGSYDLAFLLRGDKLIQDFLLHKDNLKATDEKLKEKIRARGDPTFFTRLLTFTTAASIALGKLYETRGMNMLGMVIVNQYANPPILSPQDFITYIYPFVEKVWQAFKRYRPTAGYMPPSPKAFLEISQYKALSGIACFNNYMFPQNEIGLTPPEYDEEMIALSKKIRVPYNYLVHGKFLRDGTDQEIEAAVERVCSVAVEMEAPMMVGIAAVPLGTELSKIDVVLDAIEQYGRYR
ncbi:MAG: hypothetical protein ACFFBD_19665 [Candidatus Hodarchaeota archaeon]